MRSIPITSTRVCTHVSVLSSWNDIINVIINYYSYYYFLVYLYSSQTAKWNKKCTSNTSSGLKRLKMLNPKITLNFTKFVLMSSLTTEHKISILLWRSVRESKCQFLLLRCFFSVVQRSGDHQPLPLPGQQRRFRLGRDAGHRPLQQQDVSARSCCLSQLCAQVWTRFDVFHVVLVRPLCWTDVDPHRTLQRSDAFFSVSTLHC